MSGPSRTVVIGRGSAWMPHGQRPFASYRGEVGEHMSSIIMKNVPSAVDIDCVIEWIIMRSARRHLVASIARRGGG